MNVAVAHMTWAWPQLTTRPIARGNRREMFVPSATLLLVNVFVSGC